MINKAKNPEVKQKELKAQILYRLEKYDESYGVYRDILKNTSDDEFEVLKQLKSIRHVIHLIIDSRCLLTDDSHQVPSVSGIKVQPLSGTFWVTQSWDKIGFSLKPNHYAKLSMSNFLIHKV